MADTELPLSSREYKLMLSTTRFHDRKTASEEWMKLVNAEIVRAGGTPVTQEALDQAENEAKGKDKDKDKETEKEKKRRTWFLDTSVDGLRELGWILRVRRELEKDKDDEFNLTLKFRSPDRFVSSAQDLKPAEGSKSETKFEEDVIPAFISAYSHSTKIKKLKTKPEPATIGAAAEFFPVLGTLGIPVDTPLVKTDNFEAREIVLLVGGFRFGGGPDVKMSLTFWYVGEEDDAYPMIAELSFSLEPPKEGQRFPLETVSGTDLVFRRLQAQAGWMDASGTTKSALVATGV